MHRRGGPKVATIATALSALVLAAVGALVFVSAGGADAPKKKAIKLTAKLSGQNEIPPADPDGSGTARVELRRERAEVCFRLRFAEIQNVTMAHIHKGAADVNGPIKVLFFERPAGVTSPARGCVEAKRRVINKVAKKPGGWYVNLHTADFPAGAIRGQLKRTGGGGSGGGGSPGGDGSPPPAPPPAPY